MARPPIGISRRPHYERYDTDRYDDHAAGHDDHAARHDDHAPRHDDDTAGHAFHDHGAHRIHAEIPATNRAAQKVVTFLGFQREGVMRKAIRRNGDTVDNEVWGLLPEEFKGWQTERS